MIPGSWNRPSSRYTIHTPKLLIAGAAAEVARAISPSATRVDSGYEAEEEAFASPLFFGLIGPDCDYPKEDDKESTKFPLHNSL